MLSCDQANERCHDTSCSCQNDIADNIEIIRVLTRERNLLTAVDARSPKCGLTRTKTLRSVRTRPSLNFRVTSLITSKHGHLSVTSHALVLLSCLVSLPVHTFNTLT